MPVVQIGLLHTGAQGVFQGLVQATIDAANAWLNAHGIRVELLPVNTKYANDNLDNLDNFAGALAASDVEIIVAAGGPQSAIAARDATEELFPDDVDLRKPVVFTTVTDPVELELRDDLGVPGGTNLVGVAGQTSELDAERLRILNLFITAQGPNAKNKIGVLVNPMRERNHEAYKEVKAKARQLGLITKKRMARNVPKIEKAFDFFARCNVRGAVVTADSLFNNKKVAVIQAAASQRIPTIYQWKVFVERGGLISFGPSILEAYQQAGELVGMLAKEPPQSRLPKNIECKSPNAFEVWVNKPTAISLGYGNFPEYLVD